MSRIVGIDLGTTNSLVATVDSGIPYVMADAHGQRLVPSVVHFPADGAAPFAGREATHLRVVSPGRTIYSIKRFIGRRGHDVSAEEASVSYEIDKGTTGPVQVVMGSERLSPEQISALVLARLKATAESHLGEAVTRAVITVPAYFNDAQRNATKKAGELAGLTVERIINEPTAAALAYGLDKLKEHARIAVYDLGGGTFDLSILELKDGVFQVLSTNGNTQLGGDDLDRRIVEFLQKEAEAAAGRPLPIDPSLQARLREAAEAAKIRLSTELKTEIVLPFLLADFNFQITLTRSALEGMTRDIIDRTRPHCLRALADANLQPRELDQVILVGGQTRMPLVREFVTKLFGCVEFGAVSGSVRLGTDYHRPDGPALNTSQNPDEAVALGAAIQAEILSGGFKNLLLLDVTPLSLGIETFGGLTSVLIPRNSTIPIKAGEVFTTAMDHQRSMLIHVLQGERDRARDNWSLGQFALEFPIAAKGVPRVGVQFEIDANGILHVLARDLATGAQKIVEMTSAVDVNDADVQRMVEQSVEHAFDDLAARQWIEAKLTANQTVQAAEKGVQTHGAELPAEVCAGIQTAINEVQTVLAVEDPSTGAGDPRRLKAAVAALDQASLPLAELMMDKVMENMLRQRGLI